MDESALTASSELGKVIIALSKQDTYAQHSVRTLGKGCLADESQLNGEGHLQGKASEFAQPATKHYGAQHERKKSG